MGTVVADPRIPTWMLCPHCGNVGEPSLVDPRLCMTCSPPPEVVVALEREVRLRLAVAKAAAAAGPQDWDRRAVSPDSEHSWIQRAGWTRGHLFAVGDAVSRCEKVWLATPLRRCPVVADPATTPACRACWHAYRAGRGRA